MPTGTKITATQRAAIMELYNSSDDITQVEIAEMLEVGASTVSRVIRQELGLQAKSKSKRVRGTTNPKNVSVSATYSDYLMISEYAKQHNTTMHVALHALLHADCRDDLVDIIKREVAVMLEAAKTEVKVIKKKWWQL